MTSHTLLILLIRCLVEASFNQEPVSKFESKIFVCSLGESKGANDNWPLDWLWASNIVIFNGKTLT